MRWMILPSMGLGTAGMAAMLALGGGCSASATSFGALDGGDGGASSIKVEAGSAKSDAGKKTGTKTGSDGTLCGDVCENYAKAECSKQSSCQTDCEDAESKVPSKCTDAYEAVLKCAATDELDGCDSKGKAKLAGCKDETAELLTCLQGGVGGVDSGIGSSCTLQLTTGDTACDTCLANSCCTPVNTCAGTPDCMTLLSCEGACTTPQCITNCESATPGGVTKLKAVDACMASSCSTACGN